MQRRSGFTLTDLVVGLFCLGITSAVAAPMLLQVQERANLERCANNLKQIGIAAHNYHGDFDKLPPGYLGPMDKGKGPAPSLDKPEETLNVGSLALLLPYLEQDNLFKQFRDTASTGNEGLNLSLTANVPAWWRRGENLQVAQTNLQKIFHCPSDPWEDTPSTGILAAFHCAEGKMQQHILDGSRATILGRTNYTGVAGLWGRSENPFARHFEGVLFNRSKLTLGQIVVQDGTSNTLMFGEGVGGLPRKPRDTAWSWMGVGSMATQHGLSREPTAHGAFRFGSKHEKVTQFALCDGSVRRLRFAKTAEAPNPLPATVNKLPVTDWLLFQQMAGRNDGLNNDISPIIEE